MASNNYNSLAKIYDGLSRIIFGEAIVRAQVKTLQYLTANSCILIAGGGTGWILEEISKIYSGGLIIFYVEKSAEMVKLAKKRNCKNNCVHFVETEIENFETDIKFDAILTFFLFDNFQEKKAKIIFEKLDALLKKNGVWLFSDFIYDKKKSPLWQKCVLKIMYLFFRLTTKIETTGLVNMESHFEKNFKSVNEFFLYAGFIKSVVYEKTI